MSSTCVNASCGGSLNVSRITRGAARRIAPLAGSDLRSTPCAKSTAGHTMTDAATASAQVRANRMTDLIAA
jgi:hypothetical protein